MITHITMQQKINRKYSVAELGDLAEKLKADSHRLLHLSEYVEKIKQAVEANEIVDVHITLDLSNLHYETTNKTKTKRTFTTHGGLTIHEDDAVTSATEYAVSGFWKADGDRFDAVVDTKPWNGKDDEADERLFFYFQNFEELRNAKEYGVTNDHEFVITSYRKN